MAELCHAIWNFGSYAHPEYQLRQPRSLKWGYKNCREKCFYNSKDYAVK